MHGTFNIKILRHTLYKKVSSFSQRINLISAVKPSSFDYISNQYVLWPSNETHQ